MSVVSFALAVIFIIRRLNLNYNYDFEVFVFNYRTSIMILLLADDNEYHTLMLITVGSWIMFVIF